MNMAAKKSPFLVISELERVKTSIVLDNKMAWPGYPPAVDSC